MKVAFIFLHPFSESMGSVVRIKELSLSLEKFGVEVFILTFFEKTFNLSSRIHVISFNEFLSNFSTIYKILKRLYYSKLFPIFFSKESVKISNSIIRSFCYKIAKFLVEEEVDVLQAEQDVAIQIGILLKKLTNLPLVVDLHNISSEELVAAGIIKRESKIFSKIQYKMQKLLSEADRVVVVSEFMKEYVFNNYCLPKNYVEVVPPGGRIIIDETIIERRTKPFKIVYAGLVSYREHVDLFVKSIPFIAKHNDIHFYITNKGEAIKEIKKVAKKLGITPIFFWFKDYERLNYFLSKCHIGVLPSSNNIARKMGTPVKLFNYLSLGLPIVANDIGGWSKIIEDLKVGLLTHDDPVDFASAINRLLYDENLRSEMFYNALEAVRSKYNWDNSARRLLKVYEDLL